VKRLLVLVGLLGILGAAMLPGSASAHPLGNFTVNHFAAVDLAGNGVYIRYALDLAEIPTFQEGAEVRKPGFAAVIARSLDLRLDGERVPLTVVSHRTSERPGAGGLKTMRFDAVYSAPVKGSQLTFTDRAYGRRIGWREIVVTGRDGASVMMSSSPASSRSNELRSYPTSLLRSPLDVRRVSVEYSPGSATAPAPQIGVTAAPEHQNGGFESLIQRGDLSVGVILLSLLIAAFWGAVHALTPGHGKALVAGYLVGTKGKPRHAFLLGATVTATHTAGVFALGLVTLALSQFIVPDQLYPWLTLTSGLLVVVVGASVLRQRLRGPADHHQHHGEDGHRHHDGGQHHHHHHHHDDAFTSRGILGVGVAAGLLPCPSALVVLLSAIALHRIGFGFALIAAFSLGLAITITCIGLVAVLARRVFSRVSFEGRLVSALPAISALVILGVGVGLTVKALPGVI
jgi:nickel/cobalt exporter